MEGGTVTVMMAQLVSMLMALSISTFAFLVCWRILIKLEEDDGEE